MCMTCLPMKTFLSFKFMLALEAGGPAIQRC